MTEFVSSPETTVEFVSLGDIFNQPSTSVKPDVLVSDEVHGIVQWVLFGAMLPIVSSFGIASNIINILCFVRQGLRDPVNVSLLGLAISDLGTLVTALCISIGHNPTLQLLDLPIVMMDVLYIVFGPPHLLFIGVTSCITALITLERCLCITMPIKVKSIITPRRITIIIVCIFATMICTISPLYYISKLSWVFSPGRNRTILRLIYTDDRAMVEHISYSVNNGLIPLGAYFVIIICTCTLVSQLRTKADWRTTCAASDNAYTLSKRDQKVAKMVTAISIVFIVCFTQMCVAAISFVALPELAIDGPNQNLINIYGGISIFLESANSSVNIFIYYRMSSRYRSTVRAMFRGGKIDKDH